MELILNINQYSYENFLNTNVSTLILGLKPFCCGYLTQYTIDELNSIIKEIHDCNKKVYIALNTIANESTITELMNSMNTISKMDIDGFYISDFGVFQIFKEYNLTEKVIFNPITTITNKYTLSIINKFNVHHASIANELNLKDVIEILEYNKGNAEILAQGYYQICNSKRPLLTNFFKKFKIKSNSDYFYIKEENRDYAYPIIEIDNDLLIYIDKQRSILPYFKEIKKTNIKYLRIDNIFMQLDEIKMIIDIYDKAIKDLNTLDASLSLLKEKTNSNFKCLDNISILKKEKGNE